MKKLITVIAVLPLLVGCSAVQNAADSIQRNFKLQQLEYGNVQAAYIRGKHGGMKLVSIGDGLENVSSKI